jgi:hypothetical protein
MMFDRAGAFAARATVGADAKARNENAAGRMDFKNESFMIFPLNRDWRRLPTWCGVRLRHR